MSDSSARLPVPPAGREALPAALARGAGNRAAGPGAPTDRRSGAPADKHPGAPTDRHSGRPGQLGPSGAGTPVRVAGTRGWLRRGVAALTLALTAVAGAAGTAAAAPGGGASPATKIAGVLAHGAVYVDPAYATAVPPARQHELATRIQKTHLPIKLAIVPLAKGDAFDGDPDDLAEVLHDRLAPSQPQLILVTLADIPDYFNGYAWPSDTHQAQWAAQAVGFMDSMRHAGLADRLDKAVDLIAEGDGMKVYDQATADLDTGGDSGSSPSPAATAADDSGGSATLAVVLGAAAAALLLGGGAWLLRRRAHRRGQASPFAFPEAVFAAEQAAETATLRRRAESEVVALGEALDADKADPASRPGMRRALDAYAAAGTVLDGARGIPDLVGVLVLVREGRDAFEGRTGTLPPCFFDPLHERARRRIDWRPLGHRDSLRVAACPQCARAVGEHRAPEVLTDVDADGRRVPYFELPSERSIWAATGYGSLLTGPDAPSGSAPAARDAAASADSPEPGPDTLPARVLRGDFARTHRRR